MIYNKIKKRLRNIRLSTLTLEQHLDHLKEKGGSLTVYSNKLREIVTISFDSVEYDFSVSSESDMEYFYTDSEVIDYIGRDIEYYII